jgi:N6-adenosine-specific RNA methylase IME4
MVIKAVKYRTILADPPWYYGNSKPRGKKHRGGNPQSHYNTMDIESICQLNVGDVVGTDSCVFLWVTNPKLSLGFQVLSRWGFKYQTLITWVKTSRSGQINRGGLGFYFRGATEHMMFGTRGKFRVPTENRIPNVFHAEKSGHSVKPEESYRIIESVTEGPRLEIFARPASDLWPKRDGWHTWGNELPNDVELVDSKAS